MARKATVTELANVDVELSPKHLLVENVLVKSYIKDENGKTVVKDGKPTFDTFHVDIRFTDYKDILTQAIAKVKHVVGHAVKEKDTAGNWIINREGDERGRTVVTSSGYPAKSAIDQAKDLVALVETTKEPKDKAELKKLLMALMKQL